MSDPNDTLNEFLEALRTGKGDPRFVALGRAFEAAEERRRTQPDEMEARAWLALTQGKVPLALNHFRTRAEVESFVNGLYSLGASQVTVCNISYTDGPELDASHSDSLTIALPDEPKSRALIIELCNQHCMADSSTGARFTDEGQATLSLWWD